LAFLVKSVIFHHQRIENLFKIQLIFFEIYAKFGFSKNISILLCLQFFHFPSNSESQKFVVRQKQCYPGLFLPSARQGGIFAKRIVKIALAATQQAIC